MEIIPDNRSLNEKAKDSEWYAWILLFYLLQSDYPNQRLWEEFSHDIVYKNRFSSSSDVLKEILNKADDVEYIVPKGTFFFRARKYEKSPYEELIREFLKNNNTPEDETEKQLDQFRTVPDLFFRALFPDLYSVSKDFPLKTLHPIKTAFENWENRQFKGFDADGSGAPSCDSIKAGRANPDFIRYLYLAEDAGKRFVKGVLPFSNELRHKQYHIFIMLFDHNQSGTDCGLYFGNDIFPLNKGINRRCVFRQYLP